MSQSCEIKDLDLNGSTPANLNKRRNVRLKGKIREIQKRARMLGQRYLGIKKDKHGTLKLCAAKNGRKMGPTCTSKRCKRSKLRFCTSFTEEDRQRTFQSFWKLTWNQKRDYLRKAVMAVPSKRQTLGSRRSDTLIYFLEKDNENKQVCKKMFVSTLDLSEWMVRRYASKMIEVQQIVIDEEVESECEGGQDISSHSRRSEGFV